MDGYTTPTYSFGGPTTVVVKRLILVNLVVVALTLLASIAFGAGAVLGTRSTEGAISFLALQPDKVFLGGRIWQLVTYAFLHSLDPRHILMNMFILWMFGRALERTMGGRRFLGVYIACGVVGGICYSLFELILAGRRPNPDPIPCVGASACVIGILAIYALYYPNRQVIFLVFPMKVKYMAILLIGMDLWMALLSAGGAGDDGAGDDVAHLAHLGGAAFGFFYVRFGPVLREYAGAVEHQKERRRRQTEEQVRRKVDELLKKISEQGISTLTRKEKNFLKNASKRYQDRPRQKMPL